MKIGVILVGYNMEEYADACLAAWNQARRNKLDGHEFVICAVSLPFVGFPNDTEDDTQEKLTAHLVALNIDHLITEPRNVPETTARGMALQYLLSKDVDLIWQVDLDEFYTLEQISYIIKTVEINPWVAWWRLSFKNYVFDDKTYLVEPFTPPRIHKVVPPRYSNLRPVKFTADNDIGYMDKNEKDGTVWPQDSLAGALLPVKDFLGRGLWIKHLTWQNNDRSRRKIEYQLKGRGWPQCSFAWDESKGGLIFNPKLPIPKTEHE